MKKTILFLMILGLFASCEKNDNNIEKETKGKSLIFGYFYDYCLGERCVMTYKLTDNNLYVDTKHDYLGKKLNFIKLKKRDFEKVKGLKDYFPKKIMMDSRNVFGMPDSHDQGGVLVMYLNEKNDTVGRWRIDNDKENIPKYLHTFVDKLHEKFDILREKRD